jgi:hypothetical protein
MNITREFYLLIDRDWTALLDWLLPFRDKGVRLTVQVKKYSKKRSLESNAFYWACVVTPLAEFTGYSVSELHEEILGNYTGWETRTFRGHTREYPKRRSTSPEKMDTMDFQGLIQTGQKIAAELGCVLPDQERSDG